MADNIKIDSKWVVVKTSMLSKVDKDGLIGAGFSYPKKNGKIVHQRVLIHPRNGTDNPPNDVAGLIDLYSNSTDAVYGEISPTDMAELESLISSLGLDRGGQRKSRKNKSRKSRKNKSRKSRKNKSRK